jgi:hypothetical protein
MHISTLLLQENPPFVLAPGIELLHYVTVKTDKKNGIDSPLNCDGCGKVLVAPYYVSYGIPPSSLIIMTYKLNWFPDELAIFERVMEQVQSVAETCDIDSKYRWIFSEQNIMSSRIRVCEECQEKYKRKLWGGFETSAIHLQLVCLAIEEYQRRHTPINTAKSDYERYVISLPDRSSLLWKHFGDVNINEDYKATDFSLAIQECLSIALIPDYMTSNSRIQESWANFIHDKNKVTFNDQDQELTAWIKKSMNRYDDDDYWYRIQYCKTFINPKKLKHSRYRNNGKVTNTTTYTVVVHYSIPKGDWQEFDI